MSVCQCQCLSRRLANLREEVAGSHPLVVGVAKDQFLHRAPPDALHEGALDLPNVDARVERGACVSGVGEWVAGGWGWVRGGGVGWGVCTSEQGAFVND